MSRLASNLVAFLVLAAVGAPGVGAAGGGTVDNVAPANISFAGNQAAVTNTAPAAETFTLVTKDANGEGDLAGVRICSSLASFGTANSAADCPAGSLRQAEWTFSQRASGCPSSPPSGWSCSDATAGDGTLSFAYAFTWPTGTATATYAQSASARDEGLYVAMGTETTQVTTPAVAFNANVYRWDGTLDTSNWGNWAATPGATNVPAANFLRAENQGTNPGTISIKYTSTEFTGPGTAQISISTGNGAKPGNANNIRYCHYTSSLAQVPETGDASHTYSNFAACGATGPNDGAISINVPSNSRVWVMYWILAMPAVLPDGAYTATYSAT